MPSALSLSHGGASSSNGNELTINSINNNVHQDQEDHCLLAQTQWPPLVRLRPARADENLDERQDQQTEGTSTHNKQ
jgi:hypothetical protein